MDFIRLKGISKNYGHNSALNDISMEISANCLFGLIGPDGAGKTTLFRVITTLLRPDSGTADIFGYDSVKDFKKIRNFTGYMPGRFSLYPDLTVAENMNFYAAIFNTSVEKNYHIVKNIYSLLEPFKDRLAKDLSGGMKQKLALSCALIHNPRLLVLDEPTTGVDAVSRKEFWDSLKILTESGMTILVSTPYMDEAAKCDKVALMQSGTIMDYDKPASILQKFGGKLIEVHSPDRFGLLHAIRTVHEVHSAYLFGENIHVKLRSSSDDESWFTSKLKELGYEGISVRGIEPEIEDCFIEAVDKLKHSGKDE